MDIKRFAIFVCIALATFCSFPFYTFSQPKSESYDALATNILKLINEHRTGMGLKPLVMNDVITTAAEGHSRNMATKNVPFGHQGFDARTNKLGKQLKPANSFAENVAYGATTAREAVDMWLGSEGHRKNIEGNYNLTGIGIMKSKDGNLYYTEIFVNKGN